MKKTSNPAAKRAANKAAKKAVEKTAETPATKIVTPGKPPAKKAEPKKVPAKKSAASPKQTAGSKPTSNVASTPKTSIIANVDVGFGNSLYLRGDAPGLSWSKGVPMECQSGSSWTMEIAGVSEPFEFKVLINDSFWSSGPNETAKPGETVILEPEF